MFYRSPDGLSAEYDVAVIGAGLGGLTAANVLAKKCGRRVVLLEQHSQLGGLAAWFRRRGHLFDVSLHGFPVGMIKTCRRNWNAEIADAIVQLPAIRFENPQFSFTTSFDREDFTNKLVEVFRVPRETAERFFAAAREMDFFQDAGKSARELFEEFFPGRNDVVRLLMEPITYANGSTLDDPAISYGIVFSNFMSKGVYTFRGGTDLLIEKMREELLRNGVDIAVNARAEKIHVEGGRVAGVTAGGKAIRCKAALSNGNVLRTVRDLVGREHFPADFLADVDRMRINTSSCQVYMGIREGESIPDAGDLIFTSEEPTFVPEKLLDMDTKSRTFSLYYPKTRPGRDRYAIVSSQNARYEDWAALPPEGVKAAKEKLVADTLATLEKFVPGARDKIDWIETATPLTFERYTLHEKGASFGTKFEGLKVSQEMPQALPGLFHVGSVGIIMSGWLGAANYGVIAAANVDRCLSKGGAA